MTRSFGPALRVGNALYSERYYVVLNVCAATATTSYWSRSLRRDRRRLDLAAHLVTLGEPLAQHSIDVPIHSTSVPVRARRTRKSRTTWQWNTGTSRMSISLTIFMPSIQDSLPSEPPLRQRNGGSTVELIGEIGDVTHGIRAEPTHRNDVDLHGTRQATSVRLSGSSSSSAWIMQTGKCI